MVKLENKLQMTCGVTDGIKKNSNDTRIDLGSLIKRQKKKVMGIGNRKKFLN